MFKVGLSFLFLVVTSIAGMPAWANDGLTAVDVQTSGHRCILVDPDYLADDSPVIFMLHGLGANANQLFSLIKKMNLPPCRYVLPDGPIKIGDKAYAWFNFRTQNYEEAVGSREYLFKLMKNFSEKGQRLGHVRPIILMGISEGGVMSMEAGLNYKGEVSAIVSMNGYIWNPAKSLARTQALKNIPILMVFGTDDLVVPNPWTQKTFKNLMAAGYHPCLKGFRMGHEMTKASIAEVANFLRAVIVK